MSHNSFALLFSTALLLNLSACNQCSPLKDTTFANDGAALLKKSNCMGCHKMEGKLVGPGFADVAKKYKGDAGAAAKLETKVSKGGAGVWGTMPMPAMNNVKAEDVKTMVAYILSTAK